MIRSSILSAAVLSLTFAPACQMASADQQRADNAQVAEDDKINAARREAVEKIHQAQVEADKKIAAAQADFTKLREDYRHTTRLSLVDLDHKLDELEVTAKTSTGKTRADAEAALKPIRTSRDAIATNFQAMQSISTMNWSAARAHLDKEISGLKTLLDNT